MVKKTKKELEKIGQSVEALLEGGLTSQWRIYRINFVRGLFFGLGAALGGTIILAVVIWILGLFSEVPLLGEFSDSVRETIQE